MPSYRSILLLLNLLVAAASADNSNDGGAVTMTPSDDVPQWATDNSLQMNVSAADGQSNPAQYAVIPLTNQVGSNGTQSSRGTIHIDGTIIAADISNFNKITNHSAVAYLSCDTPSSSTYISQNQMLVDLMNANPRAIVLYSKNKAWCSLSNIDSLSYTNIVSMADSGDAVQALGYLNGTNSGRIVDVSIIGNATGSPDGSSGGGGGNNSSVAMSILYSITGLITLLFLIIIATGAVRAHRYPERYGPRGALGGRPRQSRAKGLARAVLDTLPIVKFNNQETQKPDPELELETATTNTHEGRNTTSQRPVSTLTEERPVEPAETAEVHGGIGDELPASTAESKQATESGAGSSNTGCSICTEDFKVGEDMRVLPCNHQFHPDCIDPWLVNVSGTCPLCRLDLRPEEAKLPQPRQQNTLPPPLALGTEDGAGNPNSSRHRLSRLLDITRLRQATHEEQIEALRQMRSSRHAQSESQETQASQGPQDTHDDEGERGQTARLTAKLKERFRIRTRAQSPARSSSSDSG